jgi:wobble nucleotide-excising tRNase
MPRKAKLHLKKRQNRLFKQREMKLEEAAAKIEASFNETLTYIDVFPQSIGREFAPLM